MFGSLSAAGARCPAGAVRRRLAKGLAAAAVAVAFVLPGVGSAAASHDPFVVDLGSARSVTSINISRDGGVVVVDASGGSNNFAFVFRRW